MLLRRVIEHVKAQNWTAVALDFVIVVVGVFMGIQLGNWNEARANRDVEAQYLARLHTELVTMAQQADAAFLRFQECGRLIDQIAAYLETGSGEDVISVAHCAALGQSHIYAGVIYYPPTIKELIYTGRIVLIRDEDLRTAILAFDQVNDDITQLRNDIQIDRLPLARKHPDLIRRQRSEWDASTCDFKAMAESQLFLNDFFDNHARFDAYADTVMGQQAALLETLSAQVASVRDDSLADAPGENTEEPVEAQMP